MMRRMLGSIAILALFLVVSNYQLQVVAKEIEATHEWQLLGENDTLPAGLHIRMDMTTGEKWVKLPDKDDDGKQESSISVNVDGSTSSSVVAIVPQADGSSSTDETKEDNFDVDNEPDYDFEMMHRTLSKLPEEEQLRVGGLPDLPGRSISSLTPKEREMFELRMRQIWERRQAELRQINEEQVADMPQIIKERIQSIREYLQDPPTHMAAAIQKKANNDDSSSLDTIVDILADLEYLLTDLDMARDFHTLGGWPLLSSLVHPAVHYAPNETNVEELYSSTVHEIQSHAAWALGTAVKNTGEFSPWAVEPIIVLSVETTALDLLQQSLSATLAAASTTTQQPLQQKLLYALGSFLRGNMLAQIQFGNHGGPDLLAQCLQQFTSHACDDGHCVKMQTRLLSLASDVLVEAEQKQDELTNMKEEDRTARDDLFQKAMDQVIMEFAHDQVWCNAILSALSSTTTTASLQRVALHAISPFTATCQWNDQLEPMLTKLAAQWEAKGQMHEDESELIKQILSTTTTD